MDWVEPPEALDRKHLKKHGRPLCRYRVLKLGGMETLLRQEGRLDEVGLQQALHLCRGHIKTYSEENKLFGKIVGSFYWEPQLRGSLHRGTVLKDYDVVPLTDCEMPPASESER